jgi:hypothetical protein
MKPLAHTLWGGTSSQKILLPSRVVKEKNGHWKSALFQTQIEDLPLKCCILGNDLKNKTSGSTPGFSVTKSPIAVKFNLTPTYVHNPYAVRIEDYE